MVNLANPTTFVELTRRVLPWLVAATAAPRRVKKSRLPSVMGSARRRDALSQASRDAHQSFKQLVDLFPSSKYTPDAKVRMDYIVNSLAAHEVHVANYYYRRGAYVAAANRAQNAVSEFPQTPAIEEALYIMTVSYDKLGLKFQTYDQWIASSGIVPAGRH